MNIGTNFVYAARPARILFGAGMLDRLASEIEALGCRRALVLSTPQQKTGAETIAGNIGLLSAGVFAEAAMHTPVEVTTRAMEAFRAVGADCVVAFGGGSTIGLGKAIAYRTAAAQFVVATTYAGSEVTPILGQTENGIKTTLSSPLILPDVVLYDPELTLDLPVGMSVNSALNAMAHAVEGLYAQDRNPIASMLAIEGILALKQALPEIVRRPKELEARRQALYGSWLCGMVLAQVGMALHHKLCHALGGRFDLPHAETHAVILPHSAAYNAMAAADELAPIGALFGGSVGNGLHDFAASLGAPLALKDLGLAEGDLDEAANLVMANPYWNPRPVDRASVRTLLQQAWDGQRPD